MENKEDEFGQPKERVPLRDRVDQRQADRDAGREQRKEEARENRESRKEEGDKSNLQERQGAATDEEIVKALQEAEPTDSAVSAVEEVYNSSVQEPDYGANSIIPPEQIKDRKAVNAPASEGGDGDHPWKVTIGEDNKMAMTPGGILKKPTGLEEIFQTDDVNGKIGHDGELVVIEYDYNTDEVTVKTIKESDYEPYEPPIDPASENPPDDIVLTRYPIARLLDDGDNNLAAINIARSHLAKIYACDNGRGIETFVPV